MRKVFEERRNYIVERMNKIEGVSCIMPEGAFYVMMNIKALIGKEIAGCKINSASDFAEALLEKAKVAVVPGNAFGESGEGFVRISYAYSVENISNALEKIDNFIKKFR